MGKLLGFIVGGAVVVFVLFGIVFSVVYSFYRVDKKNHCSAGTITFAGPVYETMIVPKPDEEVFIERMTRDNKCFKKINFLQYIKWSVLIKGSQG